MQNNNQKTDVYLIGNGGCARELAFQIFLFGDNYNIVGYIDKKNNNDISVSNNYIKYCGDDSLINKNINILLTIGDVNIRKEFIEKYNNKTNIQNMILDNAIIADDFIYGKGNIISSKVIISTNVKFGNYNFINIGTLICHDCVIGNNVVISPSVNIAGNVNIGDDTFIGIGATIKQGINIGNNVIVGAGAVVVDNIPDDTKVVGVPAKAI